VTLTNRPSLFKSLTNSCRAFLCPILKLLSTYTDTLTKPLSVCWIIRHESALSTLESNFLQDSYETVIVLHLVLLFLCLLSSCHCFYVLCCHSLPCVAVSLLVVTWSLIFLLVSNWPLVLCSLLFFFALCHQPLFLGTWSLFLCSRLMALEPIMQIINLQVLKVLSLNS